MFFVAFRAPCAAERQGRSISVYRGSQCGETETPSASSMKYRCWGKSREGGEGCASRARRRRRDETETSMLRCISDERVCSLYTSSYLSM